MVEVQSSGLAVVSLPTDTQILITREFAAPKHLVYRAWTTPELVKRWWAGTMGKVTVAEIDLRVGGRWRWVLVTHGGFEVGFSGEYRELVENERMVYTERFEGAPGNPALNTITLTEDRGRTLLTILVEHDTRDGRDAHVNSGMESGMQQSMIHLEEVIVGLMNSGG